MAAETGDHFGSLGAVLLFFFALTQFENPQKIRQATMKQNPILFALSNGALRARRGGRGAAGAAVAKLKQLSDSNWKPFVTQMVHSPTRSERF